MKNKEAAKLKVGDRVMWNNNPQDLGTVSEVGYCAVRIKWDNGQTGTTHLDDMDSVSRAP